MPRQLGAAGAVVHACHYLYSVQSPGPDLAMLEDIRLPWPAANRARRRASLDEQQEMDAPSIPF